ncbi:MAG TPA: hypothetical protein VN024_06620 [Bradyrhizobium sp.]|nr:hypothetical protein [Bradyrhizobium sp.]
MVDEPHTSQRDHAGQQNVRERPHEDAEQMRERAQYLGARLQKLAARSIKRPDHCHQDQDQQQLLPQRPLLPRLSCELADLIDRPGPDQLDKAENRCDPLVQKFQEFVENLFHELDPLGI